MMIILTRLRTKLCFILIAFITFCSCYFLLYRVGSKSQSFYESRDYFRVTLSNQTSPIFEQIQLGVTRRQLESKVVFYGISKAGYGNRLYSMISAFLVAVITDSALLIDWSSIEFYIECPLVDVFKKFNDRSFLDFNQKSPQICRIKTSTSNTWVQNKQLYILQDLRIPNCSRYYIEDITPYFFDLAANLEYSAKLVHYGFVSAETVEKAKQALKNSNNFSNEQKIESLFMIGFEFASHVLNEYWLLKQNLLDRVDDFFEEKFAKSYIIGIHMRSEYLNDDDIGTFLECAAKIESNIQPKLGNQQKVKWFISTEQSNIIEKIKKKYDEKVISADGRISHVAYSSWGYERALIDIELLSRCDELILTGGSTFGFLAAIKSQKRPFFVEGKRSMHECKLFEFWAPPRTPKGYAIFR